MHWLLRKTPELISMEQFEEEKDLNDEQELK